MQINVVQVKQEEKIKIKIIIDQKVVLEVYQHKVMMDIMLEGQMDGVEVAGRIRKKNEIPVIFLTAYSDNETLQRAKIMEPFGYLIKPYKER